MQRQPVLEAHLKVAEELSPFGDCADNRPEVVVEQDDGRDLPGAARPSLTHRNAAAADRDEQPDHGIPGDLAGEIKERVPRGSR